MLLQVQTMYKLKKGEKSMFKGKSVDAEALISVTEQLYKYQNYKGTIAAQKIKTDRYMPTSVIALHYL